VSALAQAPQPGTRRQPPQRIVPPRESTSSWPLVDRVGYWLCWTVGIGLCAVALGIVLVMFVKGVSALRLSLFLESPAPSQHQDQAGGFLDPIVGTLIVTTIGTLIAAPLGVGLAAWLSEYGRPSWLARTVESAIEMIAGVPSVVLAIFAIIVFARPFFLFLSSSAANGSVTGQSFLAAGAIMSLLALPLVAGATREGFAQLPKRTREASYALGKTRATTTWRVLLPSIRPSIASGVVLGMGRIIGDTAIITIVLGSTLKNEPSGHVPILGTLRGFGSTLTSYVYNNSPAGEGNAPQKAYAAAFVLLMIVLALNAIVTRLSTGAAQPGNRRRGIRALGRGGMPWTR
jgi:phosphate transport system permease protein